MESATQQSNPHTLLKVNKSHDDRLIAIKNWTSSKLRRDVVPQIPPVSRERHEEGDILFTNSGNVIDDHKTTIVLSPDKSLEDNLGAM